MTLQETIKQLDELYSNATQGEWEEGEHPYQDEKLNVALHNAYPLLKAEIERLQKEADAGRELMEKLYALPRFEYADQIEKRTFVLYPDVHNALVDFREKTYRESI